MDPNTWKQMDDFLKQRSTLKQKKREREHLRGIHQEAVQYVLEQSKSSDHKQRSGPLFTPQQPPSPAMSVFSPLRTSPAQKQVRPRRTPLALVARLLGRKAALQEGTHPFSTLLTETDLRVQGLEKTLQTLQQERLEKERNKMSQLLMNLSSSSSKNHSISDEDTSYNKIVETQTKIRLWSILAHALRQVG